MLNVGVGEMMVILLVALVVFGPNRLPEIARSVGKFMRNFQKETSRALNDLKEGIDMKDTAHTFKEAKDALNVGIFDEPDETGRGGRRGSGGARQTWLDVPGFNQGFKPSLMNKRALAAGAFGKLTSDGASEPAGATSEPAPPTEPSDPAR
jgi:sec-independent protein translocase protein TatB